MKNLLIKTGTPILTGVTHFSDSVLSGIVSSTAQEITVPADAKYAIFSCNGDFYVNADATAVIPTSATIAGTDTVELNPSARAVSAGDTISLIAPSDSIITIAFYSSSN